MLGHGRLPALPTAQCPTPNARRYALPMLSRRHFLSASSLLLAAPAFIPARVLGRDTARHGAAPNDRIGLGFIGMGIQNRAHLDAFLKHQGTHVLAICDVDTNRREHAKKTADDHYQNTDCKAFIDYRELLALPGINAVVIGTPDHWHAHNVLAAAAAGKDIYCEKPLTLTLAEARLMIDAVRTHKRVLQTGSSGEI